MERRSGCIVVYAALSWSSGIVGFGDDDEASNAMDDGAGDVMLQQLVTIQI